jgi:signal transduction histidine kinase
MAAIATQSAVLGLDRFPVFNSAAVVVAAYTIGALARRPAAGIALLAGGAALHAAIVHPGGLVPAVLGGAIVPWIVGRTTRGRRLLTRAHAERAIRIARSRERDAQDAALAERSRVARELHDAVAHNLSVIAVQAAGADGVIERDPERAAQCAALIEAAATEALRELGQLIDPRREPTQRSLAALASRAREQGIPVELHVEGDPQALPAGVDLAAYRIVQEALNNTTKHAQAANAWVTVRYEPHAVEVEVTDDGRGAHESPSNGGHGLVGIRERVALYGGTLAIGSRPAGGFRVHARLPVG